MKKEALESENSAPLGSGHGFSRATKSQARKAALADEVMAIPKRRTREVGTYFVTSRTWQSRSVFAKETACRIFTELLFDYRKEGAYRLHAFVLMSDHFHILMTPAANTSLERAVQFIKGGTAHKIRKELHFQYPVWQRGFSFGKQISVVFRVWQLQARPATSGAKAPHGTNPVRHGFSRALTVCSCRVCFGVVG